MANFSWKPTLPVLLSLIGGFVDTAGYMALQGLFTAHVTGNFVTLGAALVLGTSGVVTKLLALPTFCAVIIMMRLASHSLPPRGLPILRTVLTVQVGLLIAAAAVAIRLGPFTDGDAWPALVTGLTLVAAMAIQNAAHRIHLGAAPPSTLMTGTTTQMMIDVADSFRESSSDVRAARTARLLRMAVSVAAFAIGCAAAALSFAQFGVRCLIVPPVLGIGALMFRMTVLEGDPKTPR